MKKGSVYSRSASKTPVGQFLIELRLSLGLQQVEMAKILEVTPRSYHQMENRGASGIKALIKIANKFNLDPHKVCSLKVDQEIRRYRA